MIRGSYAGWNGSCEKLFNGHVIGRLVRLGSTFSMMYRRRIIFGNVCTSRVWAYQQ
jgi:hypothetical protein